MKKILVIAALAGALLPSCGKRNQNNATEKIPTVDVVTTDKKQHDVPFKFPAQLHGKQDIAILPQISATLEQVLVVDGQHVEKGQRMFILNQTACQAALESALAAQATAKTEVETQQLETEAKKILFDKNIISEHEYKVQVNQLAISQARLAEAAAAVKNARNDMSHTVICAPHSGVVGKIKYKQGSLVSPGMSEPLTVVSDNSVIYAYMSISESAYLALLARYGSKDSIIANMPEATLIMGDGARYGRKGKAETMSGIVDQTTGAISIRVAYPNEDGTLASGGSGQVEVCIEFDCVTIPRSATYDVQDKTFVYVVAEENGKTYARSKEVDVMRLDETHFIVNSGLEAGETIITSGVRRIVNGQEVAVCN